MSALDQILSELESYQHQEIGHARALPMHHYTSEALFKLEQEALFRKEWLCVGRLEQVDNIGDFFTREILGEPIVVVRGRDNQVRALSAICRHRYFTVAEGSGNTTRFTCRYHRWVYELDGQLRGAPHMEDLNDLEGNRCRLPEFHLEVWLGFIFVTLNADPEPLLPKLQDAEPHWSSYGIEHWKVTPWVDEVWPGNWKLAMETALEGYHVTGLHPGTIDKFMPSSTSDFEATSDQWTLFRLGTVYEGEFKAYKEIAELFPEADQTSAPQFGFFPNCAVSCGQMSSIWLTFLPIDVGHTRVIGGALTHPVLYEQLQQSEAATLANAEAIDAINAQDASAMVDLQRNANSQHAEPGLLSEKERCLVYFYRYLHQRLNTIYEKKIPAIEIAQ
jgi:phenylpropionate dioxygenase-like ring-hydroxylating dioxygenase large terminal subunit